jgi:hypothetical protein
VRVALVLAGLLTTIVAGCGTRGVLVMKPLPPTYAWQGERGTTVGSGSNSVAGSGSVAGSASGSASSSGSVAGSAAGSASGSASGSRPGFGPASVTTSALGLVWSRLPAPHRAPRSKEPAPTPTAVAQARALIGVRDPRTSLAFALAVSAGLSSGLTAGLAHPRSHPAVPAVADGPALVAWARAHDVLAPITPGAAAPPAILPGDLLVFDRAAGGRPASLIAVDLARDPRGVIDILYLAGGVIRLGHLDPTRPRTARDRERKVVNTYLRHGADQPPKGTRFLAGELVSARIRLR